MIFFKSRLLVLIFFVTHLSSLHAAGFTPGTISGDLMKSAENMEKALILLTEVRVLAVQKEAAIAEQHRKEIEKLQKQLAETKVSLALASSFNDLALGALIKASNAQRKTIEAYRQFVQDLEAQWQDGAVGEPLNLVVKIEKLRESLAVRPDLAGPSTRYIELQDKIAELRERCES